MTHVDKVFCIVAHITTNIYAYTQAVSLYALRTWGRFRASDAAAVLWALAVLKAPHADVYSLLLEKLALTPVSAFSDAELSDIYTAYVLLEQHSAHSIGGLLGYREQ